MMKTSNSLNMLQFNMNYAVFNHCFNNQDFTIILLYFSIICNVNDGSTIDNDCLKWSLVNDGSTIDNDCLKWSLVTLSTQKPLTRQSDLNVILITCNMNAFFSFDLFMVYIPECKQQLITVKQYTQIPDIAHLKPGL